MAAWGSLNKTIFTGHEDGTVCKWDAENGELLTSVKEHSGALTDLQFSKEKSHFITACKDHSSLIFEAQELQVLKKFQTDRPVNAAAMSPIRPHVSFVLLTCFQKNI